MESDSQIVQWTMAAEPNFPIFDNAAKLVKLTYFANKHNVSKSYIGQIVHVTGPTVISLATMAYLLEHSRNISSSSCCLNKTMVSSAPFPSHAVHVKPYEKDGCVIKPCWDENNQTADIIIGELALLH